MPARRVTDLHCQNSLGVGIQRARAQPDRLLRAAHGLTGDRRNGTLRQHLNMSYRLAVGLERPARKTYTVCCLCASTPECRLCGQGRSTASCHSCSWRCARRAFSTVGQHGKSRLGRDGSLHSTGNRSVQGGSQNQESPGLNRGECQGETSVCSAPRRPTGWPAPRMAASTISGEPPFSTKSLAPISRATSRRPACQLMATQGRLCAARNRTVARPSSRVGSMRSSRTTDGRSAAEHCAACAAVAASPITTMSGWASSSARRPRRTRPSPPTIRTRRRWSVTSRSRYRPSLGLRRSAPMLLRPSRPPWR
jgi:hypothetical protein